MLYAVELIYHFESCIDVKLTCPYDLIGRGHATSSWVREPSGGRAPAERRINLDRLVKSPDVMKGKTMVVMDYRTQDGLADYGFAIEFQPDEGWRVYVVFQPFSQRQGGGPQLPHQTIDSKGRRYVNWPAKVDSLGDAKKVAALWAERIHHYQMPTAKG